MCKVVLRLIIYAPRMFFFIIILTYRCPWWKSSQRPEDLDSKIGGRRVADDILPFERDNTMPRVRLTNILILGEILWFQFWSVTAQLDCKTVGKIRKEIVKAWRKSLARSKRLRACETRGKRLSPVSFSVFSLGPFVWLLARSWIRKNTDCFAVYRTAW